MSRYHSLNRGGILAVAICDRCCKKFNYVDLRPDNDSPGLRVCAGCCDERDPYKLPARQTENITLRYPRPEVQLVVTDQGTFILTEGDEFLLTEGGDNLILED